MYRFISLKNNKKELSKFIDDYKIDIALSGKDNKTIVEPFSYEFCFNHILTDKLNEYKYCINNINSNFKYIMDNRIIQIDLTPDLANLNKLSYQKLQDNSLNSYIISNQYHGSVIDDELLKIYSKNTITTTYNNGFNIFNMYCNDPNVLIFIDIPNKYDFNNINKNTIYETSLEGLNYELPTELAIFKDLKQKNYMAKILIVVPNFINVINYINGDIIYYLDTYGNKLYSHVIMTN
jgi:hypothetical protein